MEMLDKLIVSVMFVVGCGISDGAGDGDVLVVNCGGSGAGDSKALGIHDAGGGISGYYLVKLC